MVTALRIIEGAGGVVVILIVLFDIFNGVIVPRPSSRGNWLSRRITRPIWRGWRAIGVRSSSDVKREAMLGIFAPLSLVLMLMVWVVLEAVGFALMVHALRGSFNPSPGPLGSLYVSASSLFGLGQSAYLPVGRAARVLSPVINATGLGTVALLITFLFSLYANFQKREALVVTLDARAGAPPSGVTLLETHMKLGMSEQLPQLFLDWERWAAEVLDSHVAYPTLAFFRSSHDNESWISALGAVLDAATLSISTIEGGSYGAAKMMVAMGTHLVEDISYRFHLPNDGVVMVEPDEFEDACRRLQAAGYSLKPTDAAWASFQKMRSEYASRLNGMARFWATPPTQWIGDRSVLRNRHAWSGAPPLENPAEAGVGGARG